MNAKPQTELDRLRAQNAELLESLAELLSYAQDCLALPDFKPGVVRKHVNRAEKLLRAGWSVTP